MNQDRRHLIVCVNYNAAERTVAFIQSIANQDGRDRLVVAISDNSPDRSVDLAALDDGDSTLYRHYPQNPGYSGGARLVLSGLVGSGGKLPFRSVTLCNVDLSFQVAEYLSTVADAESIDGSRNWILAPDIVEDGLRYRANPHVAYRPKKTRRSLGHLLQLTYPTYRFYRWLYFLKRTNRINRLSDSWPDWKPIYSPHGCFMIFGSGYFACGGSFPESPLFHEEHAIAEIAYEIGCRTYFTPTLTVHHEGELTTGTTRGRYDLMRRAAAFYRNWDPSYSIGSMSEWFEEPSLSSAREPIAVL